MRPNLKKEKKKEDNSVSIYFVTDENKKNKKKKDEWKKRNVSLFRLFIFPRGRNTYKYEDVFKNTFSRLTRTHFYC